MGMELGGVPERSRVGTVKIHYVYMYKVLCYKGAEVGWGWLSSRAPGGSPSVGLGNLILLGLSQQEHQGDLICTPNIQTA